MVQAGGGVDGKESSRWSSSGVVVVGSRYVDHEGDDVIDVDVVHFLGTDGYVDNQLSSMSKGDVVVKESVRENPWLVQGKQIVGVPVVIVQD